MLDDGEETRTTMADDYDSMAIASIAPWIEVSNGERAVTFYRAAFGAHEQYRLANDDGGIAVARLAIGPADFWVQEATDGGAESGQSGGPIRLILTVDDPDAVFRQALAAGAREIASIAEEHGWRVGRLADPFGHHWEIGTQVSAPEP
jgi:PhnB protein